MLLCQVSPYVLANCCLPPPEFVGHLLLNCREGLAQLQVWNEVILSHLSFLRVCLSSYYLFIEPGALETNYSTSCNY